MGSFQPAISPRRPEKVIACGYSPSARMASLRCGAGSARVGSVAPPPGKSGQCSPGRPTGRSAATAQLCAPRTLCCEAFELLRLRPGPVQPSLGLKSTRPTPSLQWAHQSNLGRSSTQRHPPLEPDGANPFCATAVPPRGWSVRAVPTRRELERSRVQFPAGLQPMGKAQ